MSHPLVAAVWEQLSRPDIANILREIIGEHAAQLAVSQVQNGLVADIESLVRMVFWIKAVFDLQRSYLQGLANVHECHPCLLPYLLPSETIYSTLMYLIRVKSELLPMTAATVQDRGQFRYYLAETLLAGVRLLLLRGDGLHVEMRSNLGRAMKTAWQHPGLSNTEGYLANVILPSAIGEIGSAHGSKAYPLPSFVTGLYPFPVIPETLITDLLTGLVKKGSEHMSSFWRLFDTIWAAESALIQCHVDSRRFSHDKGDPENTAENVEEEYSQSEEARKRLARTILVASDRQSDTPPLQILATIILSQNTDGNPPLQTRKVRDAWNQMAGFRHAMDDSLSHFVRWLINRRVQLWDCNGELEAVSHEYQQHLTQWLRGSSPVMDNKRYKEIERRSSAMYIVGCPSVHPVPKALFEEHLRKDGNNLDEQLQTNPQLLSVDTSCPLCPENTKIHHARVIEPFEQLSNPLKTGSESESIISRQSALGSLSARTGSQSSSFSHSTRCSSAQIGHGETSKPSSPISAPKIKSSQSLNTMASSLNHLSSPWLDKHQKKQPVRSLSRELKSVKLPFHIRTSSFRKSASKEHRLPRQAQFFFSSSGKSLLFWGENNNYVVRFDLLAAYGNKQQTYRYDVSGIQCVAAGNRRCAIIAEVGQHYELLFFRSTSLSAEAHLTIDTPHLFHPVICMTMSRDDRRLAFIVNDQMFAYELGNSEPESRNIRKVAVANDIDMSPGSHKWIPDDARRGAIIQRKLEFSIDAKRLIIATLFEDRSAHVDVWDCDVEPWRIAANGTHSVQASPGTTDDAHLTNVFYHSLDNSVFLAASSNKYPILLSTSNSQTSENPFNTGIIHAAQSPSGSLYAVITQANEIHLWRHDANSPSTPTTPTRIKRATSKISSLTFSKSRKLLLSLPQETILQVFWLKDERLMLRTIRLFGNGEMASDHDLHGDFDRVMRERELSTGASVQSPRPSPLSGPPVADVDFNVGMSTMMDMNVDGARSSRTARPDLPELEAD